MKERFRELSKVVRKRGRHRVDLPFAARFFAGRFVDARFFAAVVVVAFEAVAFLRAAALFLIAFFFTFFLVAFFLAALFAALVPAAAFLRKSFSLETFLREIFFPEPFLAAVSRRPYESLTGTQATPGSFCGDVSYFSSFPLESLSDRFDFVGSDLDASSDRACSKP